MSESRKTVADHVQVSNSGTFSVSTEHLLKSSRVRRTLEQATALHTLVKPGREPDPRRSKR